MSGERGNQGRFRSHAVDFLGKANVVFGSLLYLAKRHASAPLKPFGRHEYNLKKQKLMYKVLAPSIITPI